MVTNLEKDGQCHDLGFCIRVPDFPENRMGSRSHGSRPYGWLSKLWTSLGP